MEFNNPIACPELDNSLDMPKPIIDRGESKQNLYIAPNGTVLIAKEDSTIFIGRDGSTKSIPNQSEFDSSLKEGDK